MRFLGVLCAFFPSAFARFYFLRVSRPNVYSSSLLSDSVTCSAVLSRSRGYFDAERAGDLGLNYTLHVLYFNSSSMMHFLLIASKDGNVQFSHYFTHSDQRGRTATEKRVVSKCLSAEKDSCHFVPDADLTLIFRWFGPCLFVVAADEAENELMVYEFLSLYVNALHRYFGKFSERHVLFNVDRLHMVLEEMVVDGELVESSIGNALSIVQMLDTVASKS